MKTRIAQVVAAAAALALMAVPAAAQQTPTDDGTSANGPITILKNAVAEQVPVHVVLGGEEIDDLHAATYDDITGVVHRGANTLTVRWDAPVQRIDFKISYAATRNNFKDVLVVRADATRDPLLRRPGSRTFTFTIPG
jgi:hypothetical protein